MPFEQHPTDPDKLVMRAGNYNLQKPWVGLTDEERSEIFNRMDWVIDFDWEYELAIEAKLKEKNT